jgi:hypothetical protein
MRHTVTSIVASDIGLEGPDADGYITFVSYDEAGATKIIFPAYAAGELIPVLQARVDQAKEMGKGSKPSGLLKVESGLVTPG